MSSKSTSHNSMEETSRNGTWAAASFLWQADAAWILRKPEELGWQGEPSALIWGARFQVLHLVFFCFV